MPLALAVDTNVFLLAHEDIGSAEVWKRVCYCPDYSLLLDSGQGAIRKEYIDYAKRFPESRLRVLVSLLIERETEAAKRLILPMQVRLTNDEVAYLKSQGCDAPIEPQLLGLTYRQLHARLVVLDDKFVNEEPIKRGYRGPGVLDLLRSHFGSNIHVVTTADLSWLDAIGDPPPKDVSSLEAFLNHHRRDSRNVECEYVEVKCPQVPQDGVKFGLVKDTMQAICAMANRGGGGWVFVGIEDSGTVHGVPRMYNGVPKETWDHLWRDIANELSNFSPRKPILTQWFIPVSEDRYIIAIKVLRHNDHAYKYRNQTFIRMGTRSERPDAVHNQRRS